MNIRKYSVAASLIVVGVIHLIPITGVAGIDRLNTLYGISIDNPNLSILLRHRAILFGLLGSFSVFAVFKSSLQLVALIAGAISVTSFLVLALLTGGLNEELRRVFVADVIAAAFLILGFAAYFFEQHGKSN